MEDSDKVRFAQIMNGIADNFRDSITRDGLRFRFAAMKRFSIEQVEAAAFKIVNGRKYTKFPTVAEFSTEIEGDKEKDRSDRAMIAWRIALDLVRSGQWRRGYSGNDSVDETVRMMGGWARLGGMLESEMPFREREFIEKFGRVEDNPELLDHHAAADLLEMIHRGSAQKQQSLLAAPKSCSQ